MEFDPSTHPHRRFNPLTKEYVLVSPHRTKRPWRGQTEPPQESSPPEFDPTCYLCPGNERAGGQKTDPYESTYVFENDFAAVLPPPGPLAPSATHPLLRTEPVQGGCDVIIFHPRHDLTLARLAQPHLLAVVNEWIKVYKSRSAEAGIRYVQIFENKGAMMGCSNPHPHGQVWSLTIIPTLPSTELSALKEYASSSPALSNAAKGPNGQPCLLCDYVQFELTVAADEGRVVASNEHWVALVPWWAVWPFETLVLPYKRHIPSIAHLSEDEKMAFADVIGKLTRRYDNLFSCPFAYSMGIHQAPTFDGVSELADEIAHLHLHFTPPLLRSASVRKFLVGFELMGEPQRDLTPEQAAVRLRECSEVHYLDA